MPVEGTPNFTVSDEIHGNAVIDQDRTPLDLDHFYATILRNVVPENCNDDEIVNRYRLVIGAIIAVRRPLPVSTLTHLVDTDVDDMHAVLDHLKSVISLDGDGVPRIYHKSFSDYLTDSARCKDPRLRIDLRIRHTQIATRCFEIMDMDLKYNILGLGDWARFMSNEDGLKEDGITDEQLEGMVPQQLRYACVYWANHLQVANVEDTILMNGLKKFVDEHMLHWFEVLSLIGKLNLAHGAIRVALTILELTSSDLHQLLSDALRFISKFYEIIKQSALHTYYSALHFAPTNSLLYRRYIKEVQVHSICGVEGGPEKWDAHVANLSHGESVKFIKFSLDSTLVVSCSENRTLPEGMLKIWDAVTGAPISTIPGYRFAIANDFSTIASTDDNVITYYNVNGDATGTTFTTSSKIETLALSSETGRFTATLSDGTVWIWDSRNSQLIDSFSGFEDTIFCNRLQFSPTGTRLAYSSENGIINLRDGISGRFIADLRCGLLHQFEFSGDGSRITSLSKDCGLTLWNSESGGLIGATRDFGDNEFGNGWFANSSMLAISANGSLLATAMPYRYEVKLWSGQNDPLAQIEVLDLELTQSLAFSVDNILAIGTLSGIKLYNINTHCFIPTLPFDRPPRALTFSPDCTRLTAVSYDGSGCLWDIRGIDDYALNLPSRGQATAVTALALSRDCSRLACGFQDGTIELWGTILTQRRIASHKTHTNMVRALEFVPDGRLFASGQWRDGTIKLWNGGDGALRGTLRVPIGLTALALSNSVLVAGGDGGVTLWSLDTLSLIHTFMQSGDTAMIPFTVAITENSAAIAVTYARDMARDTDYRILSPVTLSLFDVVNRTTTATLDISQAHRYDAIHTMTFLPDNSQLVVQTYDGDVRSYKLINNTIEGPQAAPLEHLIQLSNIPIWHGVPIWLRWGKGQYHCSALFSQHRSSVPLLSIPKHLPVRTWTHGSSMIVFGRPDGRITIVRLPINHVNITTMPTRGN